MFTGIIEELGIVDKINRSSEPALFIIKALGARILEGLKRGDSVSVNGACLTVVSIGKENFSVEAIHETLERSNLGSIKEGEKVNLEGALVSGGKVSGHFMTGHVDGVGAIKVKKEEKGEILFEITAPAYILDGVVLKGSVAVDGVSLTVAGVKDDSFFVYVIPHTAQATTLGARNTGDKVNLETDILGKYVAKYSVSDKPSNITEEFLHKNGFI